LAFRCTWVVHPISTANTDHAARTLRCLLHGFAALLVVDAFQWDADIDRHLCHGFGGWWKLRR